MRGDGRTNSRAMRLGIPVATVLAAWPIGVTVADARDDTAGFLSRLSVRVSDSSSCPVGNLTSVVHLNGGQPCFH